MTALTIANNEQDYGLHTDEQGRIVTTSLAVAERFGKEHRRVMQDIRELECSEDFSLHNFVQREYTNSRCQKFPMYEMTRDGFTFLVMGYNGKEAARYKEGYITAFNELERRQAAPALDLRNPDQLLKLLGDYASETKRLAEEVREAAPRVAFAKQVEISGDAIKVGQAAKLLGTGQNRLFAYLRRKKWLTRKNEPYQEKINDGCLDTKLSEWTHPEEGLQEHVTTLVTGKGLAKLREMIAEDGAGL